MKRAALLVSTTWGIVVAVVAYAGVRSVQFLSSVPTSPAPALWSAHSGYVWRLWTVVYAGGMAAFVAMPLVRRHPATAARALAPALALAAATLTLQSVLFP